LLYAFGEEGGVGIGAAGKFEVAAVDVDDGLAIGGPGDVADVLAVVGGVGGQLARGEVSDGEVGDPDVALALLVRHPDDARAFGGCL
jgi:hypothetical protein